jgi:hypothetical protein
VVICGLALGCDAVVGGKPASPTIPEIATSYTKLAHATNRPVDTDPTFATLCIGVSRHHVEAARAEGGPHTYTRIMVYMNDSALQAFKSSARVFPEGAIVVKEKKGLAYNDTESRQTAYTPNGVGGMVKRQAGYDPQHGDWEYFYFEDPAKIESGKIASCVKCHEGAGRDHVFGNWAKER